MLSQQRSKYFVCVLLFSLLVSIYLLLGDNIFIHVHTIETRVANATVNQKAATLSLPPPSPPPSQRTQQRRHLLLHVGPEKTGSSYIQSSAEKLTDVLARDNYQYFGRHEGPSSMQRIYDDQCHRNASFMPDFPLDCPESQEFKNLLKKYHDDEGRNLFLSQEHLWNRLPNAVEGGELYQAIHPAFDNGWDTTVVFVYRRLFELIPSHYSEYNRRDAVSNLWPDQGGVVIPGIVDFYEKFRFIGMEYSNNTYLLAKTRFAERFQHNFTVLNLHQPGDLMENLICSFLQSDGNHTCSFLTRRSRRAATDGVTAAVSLLHGVGRPSYELGYDRLAVEAYQRGYLKNPTVLSRREAAWRIQHQVERMENVTLQDFPQVCLDRDALQEILSWSKQLDQDMLGAASVVDGAEGERQFEFDFETTVMVKKRYCSIDVEKVVTNDPEDPRWQTILRALLA